MKTINFLLIATRSVVPSGYGDDLKAQEVDIKSDTLFAPIGFDDNDEVSVVLDGHVN